MCKSMFGIKASRRGFDVKEASDKQLSLTSEAPLLPIEAEGEITLYATPTGEPFAQDIYTHNLGYTPVFIVDMLSGRDYFFPLWARCNDTKIWWNGWLDVGTSITLRWRVFRRPLELNYTAPIVNSQDATKDIDDDYGVLVSLPGKSVNSTDKRDFSVRSDCRQLMVAKSGYIPEGEGHVVVTHNLGYKPMYLAYVGVYGQPSEYRMAGEADDLHLTATDTTLTITAFTPPWPKIAYILFRDTLEDSG